MKTYLKIPSQYPVFKATICSTWDKGYRYGFNGKESIKEYGGDLMIFDLGERDYDARIARMFKIDPLFKQYPFWSPYSYASNCPVSIIDYLGLGPKPDTKDKVTIYVFNKDPDKISSNDVSNFQKEFTKAFNRAGLNRIFNLEFKEEKNNIYEDSEKRHNGRLEFNIALIWDYGGEDNGRTVGDISIYKINKFKIDWLSINKNQRISKLRELGNVGVHEFSHQLMNKILKETGWKETNFGFTSLGHFSGINNIMMYGRTSIDVNDPKTQTSERLTQTHYILFFIYAKYMNNDFTNNLSESDKKLFYEMIFNIMQKDLSKTNSKLIKQ